MWFMHSISNCATKSLVRFRLQKSTTCTILLCQVNKIMSHLNQVLRIEIKLRTSYRETKIYFTITISSKETANQDDTPFQYSMSKKLPDLPESSKTYQKLPRITRKYQEWLESTRNGQRLPEFSKKYQEIQGCTRNHYIVPQISRKHQKLQEGP